MSISETYLPDSYIKEVAIEIDPDYEFDNSPYPIYENATDNKKIFIGREKHSAKLKEFLKNPNGVYLVTGYRGMGKTSFVNKTIYEYKEDAEKAGSKKIEHIEITLTQTDLKEIDILRIMVSNVFDKYKEIYKIDIKEKKRKLLVKKSTYLAVILIALLLATLFCGDKVEKFIGNAIYVHYIERIGPGIDILKWIEYFTIFIVLFIGLPYYKRQLKKNTPNEDYEKIKKLKASCYSQVTKEKNSQTEAVIEALSTKFTGPSEKETQNYPAASPKEIEYELDNFLKDISSEIKFIFIFDELDKVEPAVVTTSYYQDIESFEKSKPDNTYLHQLRDRKQAILNIIAGLKYFLTTARANFIFIAGREMFDASLADIADRQSSVSSIFNYVFYIDSLLKDNDERSNSASLSITIEDYLKRLIFTFSPPAKSTSNDEKEYKDAYAKVSVWDVIKMRGNNLKAAENDNDKRKEIDFQIAKIIVTLQNFIIYLTYRSNGSPKKLIRSIHEFIRIKDMDDNRIILLPFSEGVRGEKTRKYLYFNYNDQYRIGFINYLYKPFLVRYGRSLKDNSDSIIVATPYLFDHLLKFHPFAFSLTNLELIPEVLATSKTPSLKEHIKTIIDYLSHSHIRETEIGLFDYKYYSRTLNELTFISKTFEEEGAAFNFTLDESYLVKLHVRSKIKELRSIYSKFNENSALNSRQIFSIAFLNGILGDLHFFDEEYDDAIIAYSDGIKPINNLDIPSMSMVDFITLIRNKLKLGLCFEKINSYEESLAFYTDAALDSKRFIMYQLQNGKYITHYYRRAKEGDNKPETFYNSSLNDLLQIVNQAFLAKMIVQEKMGLEGITANKVAISLGGFLKLSEGIEKFCGKNHLIHANFYLMIGNILYFKNENIQQQQIIDPENKLPDIKAPDNNWLIYDRLVKFTFGNSNTGDRKPLIGMYFYFLGIKEILESKSSSSRFSTQLCSFIKEDKNLNKNLIKFIYDILNDKEVLSNTQFSKYHFKYMAILLSNIGDCLLGIYVNGKDADDKMIQKIKSVSEIFKMDFITAFNAEKFNQENKLFTDFLIESKADKISVSDILKCYYLAAEYFKKRGRNISASFQYRKILYTFRLILDEDIYILKDIDNHDKIIELLNQTILHNILIITSQNSEFSDRHAIKKLQKYLPQDENPGYDYFIRNNISNHPETREAILLFAYIKLKLTGIPDTDLIKSYNSLATQFTRLVEVEYFAKSRLYSLNKIPPAPHNYTQQEKNDIIDYVYSLIVILRILNIYGSDYLVGHSFKGYIHFQLAKALNKYKDLEINIIQGLENINKDTGSYSTVDPIFHYEMAIQSYQKAEQLHQNGAEYKNALDKMLYLEDDINDNAAHFGAAMERYLLNNGTVKNNMNECQEELANCKNEFVFGAYSKK